MQATALNVQRARPYHILPSSPFRCSWCNNLERQDIRSIKGFWEPFRLLNPKPTAAEFILRPDEQCSFCGVIVEGFWAIAEKLGYERDYIHGDFGWIEVKCFIPDDLQRDKVMVGYAPYDKCEEQRKHVWEHWYGKRWYLELGEKAEPLPWSALGTAEPPMTLVRAATMVKTWMNECESQNHNLCSQTSSNRGTMWTPTRLLKLSRSKLGVRLIETKGRHFPYTALSYCWGQSPTSLTKRWNYRKRLLFLSLAGLPRLHLDSIELTRLLDLRYIWIDAFCIVQDDEEDWRKEAALMAEVYGNAAVVISAAHASNVKEGLVAESKPTILRNKLRTTSDQPSEVYAWPPVPHKLTWSPPRGNVGWPALMRGWTFQERLLASRCVHFGPRELLWECSSVKSCQCRYLDKDHAQSIRHVLDQLPNFSDPDPKQIMYAYSGTWMGLVREFSGRKLSRNEDRLIAISGLRKLFQSGGLGRYYAGLWENDLLQGLMWMPHIDSACYRPSKQIAPSWSWASLAGEVWYDIVDRAETIHHSSVVDIIYDANGECGALTLSAPTLHLEYDPHSMMTVRTDDMLLRSEWHLDIQTSSRGAEISKGQNVVCAFVFSFKSGESKCAMALALSTTQAGALRRIGILKVYPWEDTVAGMDSLRIWIDSLAESVVMIG